MNVADIISEFGAYYINQGQNASRVVTLLYHKSETETDFTSVITDDTVWRGAKATIGRLLQPFQKAWTPLGTSQFQPRSIEQFPVKIDYEELPDDIEATWLGFLADNDLDRSKWPIIRYIIEKLILPKAEEDYELNEVYKGVQATPTPGTAGAAGTSINGVEKWIDDGILNGSVAPIVMGLIPTADKDFVTYVENFVRQVNELYRDQKMTLYMNKTLEQKFAYGYGEKYGLRNSYTGDTMMVYGTQVTVKGVSSMTGKNRLWMTPNGNAIRMGKKTVNTNRFRIETLKRQVFVYTDYYKGVGFILPELIFTTDQV